MDSGCTFPVTSTAETKEMKAEIIPLKEELNIVKASGKILKDIGTCKMFLENEVLGGRKMVETAVIEGEGSEETLSSMELLKKWDLIHATFSHQTISNYIDSKTNEKYSAYSSWYNLQQNIFEKSTKMRESSSKCKRLREEIMKNWQQ